MKQWYSKTAINVVEDLNSDISLGLDENKVEYMRELYGKNIILKPDTKNIIKLIIAQLKQLWVIVSCFAIAMLFYIQVYNVAYILVLLIIISVVLLVTADYKEEKSLMAVDNLNTPYCEIIRNGKTSRIPCEELVVGDIVFLERGNYVPADIRILEGEDLKVKEVAVTGEKYEVEKYSMKIEEHITNLSELRNILFKSSVITEGTGIGIVIATGMDTQIGNIVKVLLEYRNDNKIFSKNLISIGNKMCLGSISALIVTFFSDVYNKFNVHDTLNSLINVSMTFTPQVLIIVLALFFYILCEQLKKKKIYIKDVSSIYLLSNVSTILTKKFGAISKRELIFREIYCDNIVTDVQNAKLDMEYSIERILTIALLCNDAKKVGNNINSIEALSESEIIKYCNNESLIKSDLHNEQERILEIPYDVEKKIKTVVNKVEDRYRANVKGALDSLLNKCTHILVDGVEKEIKEADIQNIVNAHISMSNSAYEVISFAYRNFNYEPSIDENIESNLVFVGLMAFENPIKEEAYEAIKICKEINVTPIIDVEDNKLASFTFAKDLELINNKEAILSGIEIDYMNKEEFERTIENISIFSKISSKHKSEIVDSLNNKGYKIASVGDKLTDLEYLNNSQVSIAVGNECSNVVKKLSNFFLQENDFSEIVNLIEESKKIVNYINKMILFVACGSFTQIIIMLLSLTFKGKMPFNIMDTAYLNLVTIPLSALAILIQNRNIDKEIRTIDYNNAKKICVKNSIMISIMYFILFMIISIYKIGNYQQIMFFILSFCEIIFSIRFLYEKRFLKNKTSYILLILNLLLQAVFYLVRNHNI